MEKNLTPIIKFTIFYLGLSFLISIYETETTLAVFDKSDRINAGIASYISTIVGTIITSIILVVTGYIGVELTNSFTKHISPEGFKDAYILVIIFLIVSELIVFVTAYLTLKYEVYSIEVDADFAENLKKTSWYQIKSILSEISTFGSSIILAFSLIWQKGLKKVALVEIILISILVMSCLVLSSIKWF